MQFVQPFDPIPLFARKSLAPFTDVDAMAAPAELLVWTRPTTDSAIVAHALWQGRWGGRISAWRWIEGRDSDALA